MATRLAPLASLLASLSLLAAGCDRREPAAPATPAPAASAEHADDHGHDHGAGAPTDAHTGEKHDLGTANVGAFSVAVTQIGHAHAGEAATFEIRPTPAPGSTDADITAVRAWVGVESGQGSAKVKAPKRGDFYDADLEVPAQLPEGSKAWVEIETPAGKAATGFDLAKE